ncbi:MAG TPA: class I SAM-dependent methyltransferase [Chthoniobacterales bacterium]|nr:class I SAM-dependent methyltransferase [Chthoniobacterales bacterium]
MSSKPAPLQPSRLSSPISQFQYRGHDILDLLKDARHYNRWLVDQVVAAKPPQAAEIVDLGAGRGTFAKALRERGWEVTCVEPDPENQVALREEGFPVQAGMEERDPESCDYVYTLNVLEHVPDDEALVRIVFSRLRKGNRFFIFVPAFPILWSSLDDHVEHQRRYRRAPMVAMLRRAGFVVERSRYADCLGFFAALLFGRSADAKISPRSVWVYDRLLFPVSRFLDPILGHFFGKNLAVLCRKP